MAEMFGINWDSFNQVKKPWGWYCVITQGFNFKLKLLWVEPHHRLSAQMHTHREEKWLVLQGFATAQIDSNTHHLIPHQTINIAKKQLHRLSNHSNHPLCVLEMQLGTHNHEEDIKRFEDDYHRV